LWSCCRIFHIPGRTLLLWSSFPFPLFPPPSSLLFRCSFPHGAGRVRCQKKSRAVQPASHKLSLCPSIPYFLFLNPARFFLFFTPFSFLLNNSRQARFLSASSSIEPREKGRVRYPFGYNPFSFCPLPLLVRSFHIVPPSSGRHLFRKEKPHK